jgi:glutamyl/glutaminyl-tRNA synthetase
LSIFYQHPLLALLAQEQTVIYQPSSVNLFLILPHNIIAMITRLAPTPSGFLHKGNIFNCLLNWLWARSQGGRVLLRIDDGDAARKRPEYVEDIFRVLDWLGLDWDIGPSGPDDFEQHWTQASRIHLYNHLLHELAEKGLLFACTCTRQQLGSGEKPYPGHCQSLQLPLHTPDAAWRIQVNDTTTIDFTDQAMGNISVPLGVSAGSFVVRKKDGMAAYQLCSLADDRHWGVTHIARGQDLLPSTAMQLYIDGHCGVPYLKHCQFWHHPLLANTEGHKLSKSAGHQGRSILQTAQRETILADFAHWMGWEEMKGAELTEMIQRISAL